MKHKLNHRTGHAKLNKFLHKKHNSLQSSTKKKLKCIQQSLYKAKHQIHISLEAGGYKRSPFWQRSQRIITLSEYTKFSEFGTIGNCSNYRILLVKKTGKKSGFLPQTYFTGKFTSLISTRVLDAKNTQNFWVLKCHSSCSLCQNKGSKLLRSDLAADNYRTIMNYK